MKIVNREDYELPEDYIRAENAAFIEMDQIEKEKVANGFSCWSVLGNDEYTASHPTVHKIPSGFYEIIYKHSMGCNVMVKKSVNADELYKLPSKEITDIIDDIRKFWDNREKYRDYNFVHKRGILLYGEPGCGKSGIIQLCTKHLIDEMNGIVINIPDSDAIHRYNEFIDTIRKVEPDRPLIVIMEDIDSIAGENRHETSLLLNLLDGVKQIDNIVYIATTNYPEKLEERITNRPSRFDRRYEVQMPDDTVRRAYIEAKLTKEDLERIDIDEWLEHTKSMSLAHMRELVISVMAMGNSFEETIQRLTGMKIRPRINSKGGAIGFKR
jgi:AAA+ superfamily predicted ATPase